MDIKDFFKNIGIGVGASVVKFNELGEYLAFGDASGWDDYDADFASGTSTPSKEPAFEDFGNGLFGYNFDVGHDRFINFHIKHDILVGSQIYPHVHWCPQTTMIAGETVSWEFMFVAPKGFHQGESFFQAPTTIVFNHTADGTEIAGEHIITECSDIDSVFAMEVDSIVYARVTRKTGSYTGGVFGIKADLHYRKGRFATKNKAPDFYN